MNKILILEEKYGTWRFDVSTNELLYEVCQKFVKARNDCGYYYSDLTENDAPEAPVVPENLENQPSYVKQAYSKQLEQYKSDMRYYNRALDGKSFLDKALQNGGPDAVNFLKFRSEHEYEKMEIVSLDSIEKYNV